MQTTGELGFLDYGVRMYDAELGRWFNTDPLAEKYYSQSSYHYCGNNPVVFVDPNGMDYWSTSDPGLIAAFFNTLKNGFGGHDFKGWEHASDAEFMENLTYNDKSHKYYYFEGDVIDDIITITGKSFDANIWPAIESFGYIGALVCEPVNGFWKHVWYYSGLSSLNEYFDGIATWKVGTDGRIVGYYPEMGFPPIPGMKGGKFLKGLGKVAEDFHKAIKGGNSLKSIILKTIGRNKFSKFVGDNPDIIKEKNGYLSLKGNDPFDGKVYKTDFKYSDFFD